MEALERGAVAELLITPRYIDLHDEESAKAMRLGRATGARLSILSGAAAFELDLVTGGIGAILRRSSSPRAVDVQTA
jgi:stalled ribosome rescue protein Dom34